MRSPREFDLPRGWRKGPKAKPWVILTFNSWGKGGRTSKGEKEDVTGEVGGNQESLELGRPNEGSV